MWLRAGPPRRCKLAVCLFSVKQRAVDASDEAVMVLGGEFVLPDAQDTPILSAKRAGDEPVAAFVGVELAFPKLRVVHWRGGTLRAAVSETTVYKNREPQLGKDKIRFAENRAISAPPYDVAAAKKPYQDQFGALVAVSAKCGLALSPRRGAGM
jgi:hypothetical protein